MNATVTLYDRFLVIQEERVYQRWQIVRALRLQFTQGARGASQPHKLEQESATLSPAPIRHADDSEIPAGAHACMCAGANQVAETRRHGVPFPITPTAPVNSFLTPGDSAVVSAAGAASGAHTKETRP